MTRKLQFFLTALLLMVGVTSAWAEDYDGTSPVYSPTNATNYASFNDAMEAFSALSNESSFEIHLYSDVALDSRVTVNNAKSLTIVPKNDVYITRHNLARTEMWFLNNSTGTLTIGNSDKAITFAGAGHADGQRIFKNILGNESTGRINIENVTFRNFKFDTENSNLGYLYLNKNANGKLVLKDVTVSNCITTEDAFIKSVSTYSDCIYLQGTINFDNCTGTDIYAAARIRLGEIDGGSSTTISASTPISIYWANATTAINTPVVVKATAAMVSNFTLTNTDLGLFGNNTDLKLTQAYTLSIGEAGAATLVLPFASTIPTTPSGLICYKLDYTSGDNITATAEESTLAANSPVLVIGTASTDYKFVSTATSGSAATGSGQTSAYGVLIGNYDANYVVPANDYILTNHSGSIGFRKADGSTNKVQAYRAYMSATHVAGAREFFGIDFGDGETTGVADVRCQMEDVRGEYFDLSGRRVAHPTKGLYIVNGKKVVIK